MRIAVLSLAAALATAGCTRSAMTSSAPASSAQAEASKSLPAPEGARALSGTLEAFTAACSADLERARARITALKSLKPAKEFGKGLYTRRQMFLAAVALDYYSREPGFDTTEALEKQQEKYSPFRHEYRDGTYFQLSFGHLEEYSAAYYTYVWSLVIAKDLETEFQKHGYLDPATTMKYRKTVLEPGGSKPAAELVKDFLGRPYGFEAYRHYLDAK